MEHMNELTTKVNGSIDKLMGALTEELQFKSIKDMTVEEFELLKTTLELVDSFKQLIESYTKTLAELDGKINKTTED